MQGGPAHQSPLQLDFGAANFSEEWKEAELGRPPPADAAALDALSREIALLEAALELCDTVPCVDAMAEAAAGNLPSCPHDTQRGPSASQQSKRKLSAMTGAAVLPDAPGEAPCSIEVPETEQQRIGSPTQCTSALDAPSMPQQLCVAGEEEADVGAQQGAADGAAPTATALKRRRMEQTMAAAEAAAERAIRSDHIGRVQLGLQQNRAGAAGGVQGGGPAVAPAIGSRVEVVWTDGLYTGVVQAANAFEVRMRCLLMRLPKWMPKTIMHEVVLAQSPVGFSVPGHPLNRVR